MTAEDRRALLGPLAGLARRWSARNSVSLSITIGRNLNRPLSERRVREVIADAVAYCERLRMDIDRLSDAERSGWASYINSFQCADGLYRDPAVDNEIAEAEDWWGWRHLTCLTISALHALGAAPSMRLSWLDEYSTSDEVIAWLARLDWGPRIDFTSNLVMNRVAAMQYARDFMGEERFAIPIERALDDLQARCGATTGLWGEAPTNSEVLTRNVQAAYHFWLLLAYEGRALPYARAVVPLILATQSRSGGFSPIRVLSSACEDIDSIDPLSRILVQHPSGDPRISSALSRGARWVAANFGADGGAVFRLGEEFTYGHPLMRTGVGQTSIFATWFRLLAIAIADVGRAPAPPSGSPWRFLNVPGYQISPQALLPARRFSRISRIPTSLSDLEKWTLFNSAQGLQAGAVAVEIGSYLGASSCYLAEGLRKRGGKLYCVDTWANDAMTEGARDTYGEFAANTGQYGAAIVPLRGRSVEIAHDFHHPVDLLFVDGDHSYDAVRDDLNAWLPKVRASGGLVMMHDSGWAQGVRRAISEFLQPTSAEGATVLPNMYAVRVLRDGRARG